MQVLEGPQDTLNEIYLKIAKDERHTDLKILDYSSTLSKRFNQSGMGSVDFNFNPLFEKITKAAFQSNRFSPYELNPRDANDFMNEYAKIFTS